MHIAPASCSNEPQTPCASFAAVPPTSRNASHTLRTCKVNLSLIPDRTHTLTVRLLGVPGGADDLLNASGPVNGSSNGSPAVRGETIEVTASPWLSLRLGLQYVAYRRFNGGSTSCDLPGGRNARDSNALYAYLLLSY